MAIYKLGDRVPQIDESAYIFESADIIGDVRVGPEVYIGPGARLRGDYGTIIVGRRSMIEDNCVVHARPDERTVIGERVTVGHGAILHNCTLCDNALIGMGGIVADYATVKEWGVVAEGAVVRNKFTVPSRTIVAGVPAKVIGEIDDDYIKTWTSFKGMYPWLATERYPQDLKQAKREECPPRPDSRPPEDLRREPRHDPRPGSGQKEASP